MPHSISATSPAAPPPPTVTPTTPPVSVRVASPPPNAAHTDSPQGVRHPTATSTHPSAPNPRVGAASRHSLRTLSTQSAVQQTHTNQQVTHAQQGLLYLQQTLQQLHALKNSLKNASSTRPPPGQEAIAQQQLQRFQTHWRERLERTAGTLSAELKFSPEAPAQQHFRIPALSLKALSVDTPETLVLYPHGPDKAAIPVTLDASVLPPNSPQALIDQLSNALARSNIQVREHQGELVFSAPETQWERIQSRFMIQGQGIRFAAGAPHRISAQALPGTLAPDHWRVDSAQARQLTLEHIHHALKTSIHTEKQLKETIESAAQTIQNKGQQDPGLALQWAQGLVQALEHRDNFQHFSALSATLRGINRARVQALLGGA